MEYRKDQRNKVKRVPKRGAYDHKTVYEILDAGQIAHVSFVVDGQPFIIPTLYGREDNTLFIHGSTASRMLKHLKSGVDCALAVTIVDGLVLARSAFHHSMNYRSVIVYGKASLTEGREKVEALKVISDQVINGRWEEVREPNDRELKGTEVLKIPIDQASAKIRTGPPADDREDYELDIWAGVVPLKQLAMPAEEDPGSLRSYPVPPSVTDYLMKKG